MTRLTLKISAIPERCYDIRAAHGLMDRVRQELAVDAGSRTCFWIWDQSVWNLWQDTASRLGWPREGSRRHLLFAGSEQNKRLSSIGRLGSALVERNADRSSALVAVGGGVTGDVVGFLAAIYMRGIPFYQLPTTLLAQVDSSVGGKTAVDLPEGKNLLGSFHQPSAVWIDPHFLSTLPAFQFRQGMAEVIKTALLGHPELWQFLEQSSDAIRAGEPEALLRMITESCRVKARVVAADEKEGGRRRILNLGHTVGHALERLSRYELAHGDAVAMGMIAAAEWAVALKLFHPDQSKRLRQLCRTFDLPTEIPPDYAATDLIDALRSDKKYLAGQLHFILPVGIGEVIDRTDLDLEQLTSVLNRLGPA